MCINCTHRHMLIIAALFSRDVGALADFTLPPEQHAGQTNEEDHRRAIGIIGDIVHALLPSVEVMTRPVPQSVIDAERRVSQERLKEVYNRQMEIRGKSIPGGAVVSHAALAALYYAEMLLFASRQIETMIAQQAREQPQYPGPRAMLAQLTEKRAELARQLADAATFIDGTKSDDDEFPPDMPEEARALVRQMRAAGLPVSMVGVVAPNSPAQPIGTGPDGKLH